MQRIKDAGRCSRFLWNRRQEQRIIVSFCIGFFLCRCFMAGPDRYCRLYPKLGTRVLRGLLGELLSIQCIQKQFPPI